MKKNVKYLISIILIFIVFVLIGEMYVWYLYEFDTSYTYTTMYLPKDKTEQQMVKDIVRTAKKRNVDVFVVDSTLETLFRTRQNIYGTEGVFSYLKENRQINSGEYQSIFLGYINIQYHSIHDIPDLSNIEEYRLIGDSEDIIRFKQDLVDIYGGSSPREGYDAENFSFMIGMCWGIVFLFFLLMTLYEIAIMKKETLIRLISGESLNYLIGKNIIMDILFYILMFALIGFFASVFTLVNFYLNISLVSFLIFLIINSILYLSLYFINYQKDLSSKKSAKSVLKISYGYKVVTIIITVLVMSSSIELIYQGIQFYKQKDFFENRKEYSYVTLNVNEEENQKYIEKDEFAPDLFTTTSYSLYKQYLNASKTQAYVNLDVSEYYNGTEFIMADKGSIDYLNQKIPELKTQITSDKVYFIIPDDFMQSTDDLESVKTVWEMYHEKFAKDNSSYNYEVIIYENNIEFISIFNFDGITSTLEKNPVILLNNQSPEEGIAMQNVYLNRSTMVKITEQEWDEWIKEPFYKGEPCIKTNVYEIYLYQWQMMKKGMITGIVLLAIMLLLESIIIRTVLNYEYNINAIELSLKKVFGYGLYGKHKKILRTTFVYGLIGLSIAIIGTYIIDSSSILYIIFGGIMLLTLEFIFTVLYIYKLERTNVQKILKGGWI